MTFEELILKAAACFRQEGISFALVGGVAASFYREVKRTTEDVDFAVALSGELPRKGLSIAAALGFSAEVLTRAQLDGGPRFALRAKHRSEAAFIAGRDKEGRIGLGFDILLPSIPWVKDAVERAQNNTFRLGAADIPVITPEDLLIAKLFALKARSDRPYDLDDVRSILRRQKDLDVFYLAAKVAEHGVPIPDSLAEGFDYRVLRAARRKKPAG